MKMHNSIKTANLKMLEFISDKLGKLCEEVVFLGGCTTALFITDPAAPDARYTLDVDCIVDVISLGEYYKIEKKLFKLGFKKSIEDEVFCRWRYNDVILDVMPTDENILGFGNKWYKPAIKNAFVYAVTDKISIKVVTAPYFLATKLEAFNSRGAGDFYGSHDFEDIVSVLDGRIEIFEEIKQADYELKNYLHSSISDIIKMRSFHDALPGHFVQHGNLADDRIKLLLKQVERFQSITLAPVSN
jgi:hypothetical protein